jgi:hypothetical protein
MKKMVAFSAWTLVGIGLGCMESKPTATVTISQSVTPKTPLSSNYMEIAVMNARMEGDTDEFDQKKWSEMTADMVQHDLEVAAEKHKIPIKLVDREHVKLTMGEKDLAAAGVTDSGDAMSASKIKGASAVLTSKVTIKVDKQKGKSRTVDAMSAFGSAWGGGGGVGSSEVEKESRNITVQCQFQLKDPATNDVIYSYNGMPNQHYDKAKSSSPFFGSSKTEADMTPRDKVIGAMIQSQAEQFLCKFLPMQFEATMQVKPSSNKESIAGVRAMVVDDYDAALGHFKQAIAADSSDYESLYGAGVCCEKLGKMDEAKKYYKQAQSLKPKNEDYAAAVERVSRM